MLKVKYLSELYKNDNIGLMPNYVALVASHSFKSNFPIADLNYQIILPNEINLKTQITQKKIEFINPIQLQMYSK